MTTNHTTTRRRTRRAIAIAFVAAGLLGAGTEAASAGATARVPTTARCGHSFYRYVACAW